MFYIKKVFVYAVLLLLIALPIGGCEKNGEVVPYVPVNFYISLADPDFVTLNGVGNMVMVTGGFRGIIVYRYSFDKFLAFDRCCTQDIDNEQGRVEADPVYKGIVTCPICKSGFMLQSDGIPLNGSTARLGLRQYEVSYDPTNMQLMISN